MSKVRAALDTIGLGDLVHGGSGCYEVRLPAGSHVDVDDALHFVEEAETAWRLGRLGPAVAAAATAAILARRPFLVGERGAWLEQRRERLRSTLLRALDVLVDGLDGGPYQADAFRYATEALAVDPYRESAYVRLMRLHMRRGDRAEAIRIYERCRTLLSEDLGVGPSTHTQAAYHEAMNA